MGLTSGSRLGSYQILSRLGVGGMGEVYRARDTKLNRDVAIKVLPESFALDADRVARFTREAQVLASLNHPNIAAIYGIEEHGSTRALVMELVEGEDLAAHIERGPISLAESLPIARQIADALEAAHENGIVHRDLKPANIKVRADGTVKVLDFGLAKAADPSASSSSNLANSPTMTSPAMTGLGMILGTAAYMSPEQAKGRAVDKRADIWAFGVVLYEMLAGRRAFEGEDVSDLLVAVLSKDVDLGALPASTPPAIVSLIRRCLVRDPKNRLRDIGDARLALSDANGAADVVAVPATVSRSARIPWIAAAALALLALTGWTLFSRPLEAERRAIATTLLPPGQSEFDFNEPYAVPAISPDGSRIVYGAKGPDGQQQLWLRPLDSIAAQSLPGTEDAATPFWSPDSRWIGFGQGAKLKKIDTRGGPPVEITGLSSRLRGGTWNDQGVIVFGLVVGNQGALQRVAASGGAAADIPGTNGRHPWFLPDGRHFLYQASTAKPEIAIGVLDEPNTPPKIVAEADSLAVYAQGYLLYLRENTLMARPFDAKRLETTGEAVPVADGIPTFTTGSRIPGFAVSPAGLLLYQTGGAGTQGRLVWKDRQGKALGSLQEMHLVDALNLSPDGTRAIASDFDRGNQGEDLWLYSLDRGIPTRFTSDPKREINPVWSPDGATIYFSSNRNGKFQIFRKPSSGIGNEELVLDNSASVYPESISSDGMLLYRRLGKASFDLWVLPLTRGPGATQAAPYAFLETPFAEQDSAFSPDGHWVAYTSSESGQVQVYVASFPGPGVKVRISQNGGHMPRWRKDGKEIFYATADRALMAVDVAARQGGMNVGQTRKLFDGIVTSSRGAGLGSTYDVSSDGQRFLVFDDGASDAAPVLTLVQNWTVMVRK